MPSLIASSRTAFVFAWPLPVPRSCNARAQNEPAALEALNGADEADPSANSRSQDPISSMWVGLRLPACYRTVSDNLAPGAWLLAFQGCPRSSDHLLHQRFA
ncbi:hypothetical protein ASG35_14740 [Burkholderia sp. Leaf177]|nr:hypothetical protein ASG35_14740 [Burkholderia sp. Leaf177]